MQAISVSGNNHLLRQAFLCRENLTATSLCRVAGKGLDNNGIFMSYCASDGDGYTLEALPGIAHPMAIRNGILIAGQ